MFRNIANRHNIAEILLKVALNTINQLEILFLLDIGSQMF